MKKRTLTALTFLLIAVASASAQILWNENGVVLRHDYFLDWSETSARSASGDVFVAWQDSRSGAARIYCQKYDAQGQRLWPHDVEVTHIPSEMVVICPTSDSGLVVGFAIRLGIVYCQIRVQKIDLNGNLQWAASGVVIGKILNSPGDDLAGPHPADARGGFYGYNLVADDDGGIFAIWFSDDDYTPEPGNLVAKRIRGDGTLAEGWDPGGNVIKSNVIFLNNSMEQCSCPDDQGGFILSWEQYAGGGRYTPWSQRMNGNGNLLWNDNGVQIGDSCSSQPLVIRDGSGGAYFAWQKIVGGSYDMYMQRTDPQGNLLWDHHGIPLIQAPGNQENLKITEDATGGMLAVWSEGSWNQENLYCQRVNGQAERLWGTLGTGLSTAPGAQSYPSFSNDGQGGFFASWISWTTYDDLDAYVQHMLGSGTPAWAANGLLLRGGADKWVHYTVSVSTADGGAQFYWLENRGSRQGIYMQKADAAGQFQLGPAGQPVREIIYGRVEDFQMMALSPDRFLSVWTDFRRDYTSGSAVYYQLQDAHGNTLLASDGAPICDPTTQDQQGATASAMDDGGAVIAWMREISNWKVYVQRIDAQGNRLWPDSGVVVSTNTYQAGPMVCSDGAGGSYVSFNSSGLYVQRFDASGNRLFGDAGVRIGVASGSTGSVWNFFSDGEGGAIAVYRSNYILYATRVLPTGAVAWTQAVQNTSITGGFGTAIPALDGGGIVAWETQAPADIYAQRFDNAGNMLWGANGVPVAVSSQVDHAVSMAQNSDGYTYFSFTRGYGDIYCQRLNPNGQQQFGTEGIPVSNAAGDQGGSSIAADGQGGALFAWNTWYGNSFVRATHLDSLGQIANPFWIPNGNPISSITGNQSQGGMVLDGAGGAVVVLDDSRGYCAQRINDFLAIHQATASPPPEERLCLHNSPNPFNPSTVIGFELQDASFVELAVYNISGRLVTTLVDGWREAGVHEVTFDGSNLPSGIYLTRLKAGNVSQNLKLVLVK